MPRGRGAHDQHKVRHLDLFFEPSRPSLGWRGLEAIEPSVAPVGPKPLRELEYPPAVQFGFMRVIDEHPRWPAENRGARLLVAGFLALEVGHRDRVHLRTPRNQIGRLP